LPAMVMARDVTAREKSKNGNIFFTPYSIGFLSSLQL
jgi:hypothetical protein